MIARRAKVVPVLLLVFLTCGGCATPKSGQSIAKDTQPPVSNAADSGVTGLYGAPQKTWCDERTVEVLGEDYADGRPAYREEVVTDDEGDYVRHGVYTVWWEAGGGKKLELNYVCGLKHGPKRTWYQDGATWGSGGFYNGKDHGTWITREPDGVKIRQYHLIEGKWHGFFTIWYPNGQKKMEVEFVDGRQQGLMTLWDDEGNTLRKVEYADGHEQPMPG